MAVVSVSVKINGHLSSCTNTSGNIWAVTAPSDCPDGSYTCEFWAVDTAGNIGYMTAILWIFDGRLTCIKFVEDKYQIKYMNSESTTYSVQIMPCEYTCHYVKQGCPSND